MVQLVYDRTVTNKELCFRLRNVSWCCIACKIIISFRCFIHQLNFRVGEIFIHPTNEFKSDNIDESHELIKCRVNSNLHIYKWMRRSNIWHICSIENHRNNIILHNIEEFFSNIILIKLNTVRGGGKVKLCMFPNTLAQFCLSPNVFSVMESCLGVFRSL